MPKTLENLTKEDPVVFWDVTDGIIVTTPTSIFQDGTILVHYIYGGYKSTSQTLRPRDVLAIGNNESGTTEIPGWQGKYDVLNPEKLKLYLKRKIG